MTTSDGLVYGATVCMRNPSSGRDNSWIKRSCSEKTDTPLSLRRPSTLVGVEEMRAGTVAEIGLSHGSALQVVHLPDPEQAPLSCQTQEQAMWLHHRHQYPLLTANTDTASESPQEPRQTKLVTVDQDATKCQSCATAQNST